jgi:hypothetical protein
MGTLYVGIHAQVESAIEERMWVSTAEAALPHVVEESRRPALPDLRIPAQIVFLVE